MLRTFWYNFGWSDWVGFIDGWLPKLSFSVPVIGYLILFNDSTGGLLRFDVLTGPSTESWSLSTEVRLRLLYFSLIFLGVSNLMYRLKKPYIFRYGTNIREFVISAMQLFTYGNFLAIHNSIRENGHLTQDGKYYDSEWRGFTSAALNEGEGTDQVKSTGNWEQAKSRYGSLLISLLNEHFFRNNQKNRGWLIFCITLSSLGYLGLLISSLELMLRVIYSSFGIGV